MGFAGIVRLRGDITVIQSGNMITESTDFPAGTPSIVVCDRLLEERPGSRVFAKIS